MNPLFADSIHDPNFVVMEYGVGVGRILQNFDVLNCQSLGVDFSKTQIKYARKINKRSIFHLIEKCESVLKGKADFVCSIQTYGAFARIRKCIKEFL